MHDLREYFFDFISKPENKISEFSSEKYENYFYVLSEKNKRRALEDRYIIILNLGLLINIKVIFLFIKDSILNKISLYGVFDGHGGVHTAQYLSLFCVRFIANGLYEYTESKKDYSPEDISSEICNLIEKLHQNYLERYSV